MKKDIIKQLECLYAWASFYAQNQRWEDFEKTQDQIDALKKIHRLAA